MRHQKTMKKGLAIRQTNAHYILINRRVYVSGACEYSLRYATQIPKGYQLIPITLEYYNSIVSLLNSEHLAAQSLFETYIGKEHEE